MQGEGVEGGRGAGGEAGAGEGGAGAQAPRPVR